MTQQEQFEADYLAAFDLNAKENVGLLVCVDGQYADDMHQIAYEVWLQQAKRHEAEIAELHAKAEAQAVPVAVIRRGANGNIRMVTPDDEPFDMSAYVGASLYTAPPAQAVSVPEGFVDTIKRAIRHIETGSHTAIACDTITNELYRLLAVAQSPEQPK